MEKKNVWKNIEYPLELHEDERGKIADIFYKKNIQHVAIVSSKKGALRGDHYHKHTVQHMLITKGALEYWYKPVDSDKFAKCEVLRVGDIKTTGPNEIHALRIIEDNEFIVFTDGVRGGKDYESDTFRVTPSLIPREKIEESNEDFKKKLKVHLGCGKRILPGYVNIDLDNHPHIDYYHDIKTLPMFEVNTVDEIYSCGTLEYFDRITEIPKILSEWKRVLKSGGSLRTSVPDFKGIVKVYEKFKDVDGIGILGPIFGRIEINTQNGKDIIYHKTVYDFDSIKKIMEDAGFVNVRKYNWKEFFPKGYDDYSAATIPHMDPNGIPLGLNIICEKP